jgi:cysteine-rich repeat protein
MTRVLRRLPWRSLAHLVLGSAAAIVGACLEPAEVACGDGTVCPAGTACDGAGACVDTVAIETCAGQPDQTPCDVTSGVDGECHDAICRLVGCGNGRVDRDEACDDGNTTAGDGCAADCGSREQCGDGVIDDALGEQCDDGNRTSGDACQATCQRPACGDGVVDEAYFEACDLGADNSGAPDAACRPTCQLRRCGDGVRDPAAGEICDDGNVAGGDGCSADCGSAETCGNDLVDPGEECDDGNDLDGDGCQADCRAPICGDGIVDAQHFEECDLGAGNSDAPDAGCRPNCRLRACGDGVVDVGAGELCDDGGRVSGDGCSFDCASLEVCGNGTIDYAVGEQCDDADLVSADGCDSRCAAEVREWVRLSPPAPKDRLLHRMVYDEHRGRLVLFGGVSGGILGDTWEFVEGAWRATTQRVSPSARSLTAMTYDSARHRIILFGGSTEAGDAADTWAYDGQWVQLAPAHDPGARSYHNLAYDRARDRVVLFGGRAGASALADTWEFDGTDWAQVTPAQSPSPQIAHAMAYDESDGQVVLFTGVDLIGQRMCQTYGYAGATWSLIGSYPGPCPVQYSATYDASRQRVVLYSGGYDGSSSLYEFDGSTWTTRSVTGAPGGHPNGTAIGYDRAASAVMIAGNSIPVGSATALDAWRLSAASVWSRVAYPTPPALAGAGMVFDTARVRGVMFGGLAFGDAPTSATWSYQQGRWRDLSGGAAPPARSRMAIAYDAARDRVVLFGGEQYGCGLADTWEFDGTSWQQHAVAGPDGRQSATAVWDSARGLTYVFGGHQCTGWPNDDDLWAWDGVAWTEVEQGAVRPSARRAAVATYDPVRDRVVLFGGHDGVSYLADTWEFDPATHTWSQVLAPAAPLVRAAASLTFDPIRGRVVFFGGNYGGTAMNDVWEYDGGTWTKIATLDAPTAVMEPTLLADVASGTLVAFGGRTAYSSATITASWWGLRWRGPALPEQCELAEVDNDGDGLAGCDDPDCWYVCAPTCSPLAACDDGPFCGDGACALPETAAMCGEDCGP